MVFVLNKWVVSDQRIMSAIRLTKQNNGGGVHVTIGVIISKRLQSSVVFAFAE